MNAHLTGLQTSGATPILTVQVSLALSRHLNSHLDRINAHVWHDASARDLGIVHLRAATGATQRHYIIVALDDEISVIMARQQ